MLDYGATASHSNAIRFADRAILDAMTKYTMAMTLQPRAAGWTNARGIFSKWTSLTGWTLRTDNTAGNNFLRMVHGNGAATAGVTSTTALTSGTTYRIIVTWDGSTLTFYVNNSAAGSGSLSTAIAANANKIALGNEDALGVGAQVALGNATVFPNYVFSSGDRAQWDAGQTMPALSQLELWHKGLEVPGYDRIRGEQAVTVGTVVTLSDATDAYFPDELKNPQWRRIASHRLRRRRTQEPVYQLVVPDHYLALNVGELCQMSHDAAPLSAMRLAGETPQLPIRELIASQQWRRSSLLLVGKTDDPVRHQATLRLKDHEAFGATYWTSDVLPEGTNDAYNGLARLDVGGDHTVTRASKAYLEQANNVKEEAAFQAEGQLFRTVGAFAEKMNHIGFIAEDAVTNKIIQSHAKNGETGWTSVDNGGTTDLSTLRLAFPLAVTGNSWRFVRTDNGNNTYREQLFAVVTGDSPSRIYVTKSEENVTSIVSWQLQRSTDSFYWNDATPGWQSGAVWNRLSNGYDAVISKPRIARAVSNPVTVASNENWTIRIGLEGAALPAGGGEINVYAVEGMNKKLRFTSIPTEGTAVTTSADEVKVVRTALPQIVSATRYTMTLEVEAVQAGGDLVDGDKLVLWYHQWGSNTDNRDQLIYEKPASANPRFAFERYISGSFSARATYEVTIVPGTVYRLACVACAASGNDLGLTNSTLRILVNGAQGVDGVPSGNHSASTQQTELWKGCAPTSLSMRTAMNYFRELTAWTRCLANEEVPA